MEPGEHRNITRLIRVVALFVAVPTLSIGLVLLLYAPREHAFHMTAFLSLGAMAIGAAAVAPRLAARFTAAETQ